MRRRLPHLDTLAKLGAGALVVAAALGATALVVPARGATTPSLTAVFSTTSQWQGGYIGQYVITNEGSTASSSWQLSFELPAGFQLAGSWSGVATTSGGAAAGTVVQVANASWNGSLAPGTTAVFGFQVLYFGSYAPPESCTIDGGLCAGGGQGTSTSSTTSSTSSTSTTLPAVSLQASFDETSSWSGGYVGQYTITNVGHVATTTWQLDFDLPAGASLVDYWNGQATSSGAEVRASPAGWNGSIAPGSSTTFGFQVTATGAAGDAAPNGCSIDASSCAGGSAPPSTPSSTSTTSVPPATTPPATTPPGGTGTTTTTIAPGGGPTTFAPYVDMTLQNENLAAISEASGIKDFTLAFVVTDGTCSPSWGTYIPVGGSGDYVGSAIEALRAVGGSVIISFGGEANTSLADSCTSVASLEAAYQKVVDTYQVYSLDFDIEGADVGDTASIDLRSQALALLQKDEAALGHAVTISYTLPVLPNGFPTDEINVIRAAVSAGVALSIINPMTMDYGDGPAPDPSGNMGTYAIDAAQAVEAQLAGIYPSYAASRLWSMIGITPMIGQNDITDEVFTVANAEQVAAFASAQRVGRLAMWSTTRDQQCSQGVVDYDDPSCSGILQSAWAFSHAFEAG
ncbi:MAG TPA: cellulose binding domain-containing protein [Acidimicrobiales bacterium]|nr:cellulose binding domain-containing protein [Acidimicrobiales bacterium]